MPHVDNATLIKRYERARSDRQNFDSHWQTVADLVLPTRQFTSKFSAGARRRNKIFDDTAPLANEMYAAALHGLLTNPSIRWLQLKLVDQDVLDQAALEWLQTATDRVLAFFASPRSGWATSSHELYLDLGAFGTGVAIAPERANGEAPRFQARNLASVFIAEDENGEVGEIYRIWEARPDELVRKFGADAVSENVRNKHEQTTHTDDKIMVLHAVWRQDMIEPDDPFISGMPWQSRYLEIDKKNTLRQGGFDRNPYLIPRLNKAAEECYGRGPAMQVLPAIKLANAVGRDLVIAAEQAVRPPINVPVNALQGPISTAPGSINYVRAGTRDRPEPMNLGTQPLMALDYLRELRASIREAYFLDKIELPRADQSKRQGHPRMTLGEVVRRQQLALIFTSPTVSRLQVELMDPAVSAVFRWLLTTDQLPDIPDSLRGRTLKAEYESPLAQSQRASESNNILSALTTAQPLIAADPTMLENLDPDESFRGIWEMHGAPASFLRRVEEVRRVRQERAQADQAQQQAEIAESVASAGRDAGAAVRDLSRNGQAA